MKPVKQITVVGLTIMAERMYCNLSRGVDDDATQMQIRALVATKVRP